MQEWLIYSAIIIIFGFWMSARFEAVITALSKINDELCHQRSLQQHYIELISAEISSLKWAIEKLDKDEKIKQQVGRDT